MIDPETLTKLLNPSDDAVEFTARMFTKMIRHSKTECECSQSMLYAYRHILETTAHDLGLKFQTENPEMEHGYKA